MSAINPSGRLGLGVWVRGYGKRRFSQRSGCMAGDHLHRSFNTLRAMAALADNLSRIVGEFMALEY